MRRQSPFRRSGPALATTGLTALALAAGGLVAVAPHAQAAEAGDVVVNEIMYNPASDLDGDEFLELRNTTGGAVDISGWTVDGIDAVLPAGARIPARGYFTLSPDPARYTATYGGRPGATYEGKLSNGGETLELADAGGTVIDAVTYADTDGWAVTPDGVGPSLELIDPAQDHDDPLNWAASNAARKHTAGAANSVAGTGLGPRVTDVSASPADPAAGQAVIVTATVTGAAGRPTLRSRVDFGTETSVLMTAAGGNTFRATLPGVAVGHLLRYRVTATNANRPTSYPRVDDTVVYQGVVARSSVTSNIPVLQWFIRDADYQEMVNSPTKDIVKSGVLAVNGQVVDNITTNIRGHASQKAPKVGWTFRLPQGHTVSVPGETADPVDSFAMVANWGDKSHGRQYLAWETFTRMGGIENEVFPVHTRRNGAFQGLYIWVGLLDGTWRDREGYDDIDMYKAEGKAFASKVPVPKRYSKENPKDDDFGALTEFLDGLYLKPAEERAHLLAHADIPELVNYAASAAIVQHVDGASHNFYLAQDPETGRWTILPWDLDHTFGNTCCKVTSDFLTPAEGGDKANRLLRTLLEQPDWRAMYFRRLRSQVDQILAPGVLEGLYDAKLGPAKPEATMDLALWPTQPSWGYEQQRTALFRALDKRRAVFTDPQVPPAQSAAPRIVINEIQHSPTGGGDAEFLELYNPSATEAVDLSGWTLSEGIDLTFPPGTVILPRGYAVVVGDDPTFRETYGTSILQSGRYDGGLGETDTVVLTRANGSVADTVTYGGAGWPLSTGGRSLELTNPASDNDVGANWTLSSGDGTPGAANS